MDRGSLQSSPPLVTLGRGVLRAKRCGILRRKAYEEDRGYLFINHLHDGRQDRGEGITSFYVRRSVYFAFFGKPASAPSNGHSTRDSPKSSNSDLFQLESTTQSPRITSDEMDLIMAYYTEPSQSGVMDIVSDRTRREDNEGPTSRSEETHALIVRGQFEERQEQLDQEQEEQQEEQQEEEQQEENQQEEEQQQNDQNRNS